MRGVPLKKTVQIVIDTQEEILRTGTEDRSQEK